MINFIKTYYEDNKHYFQLVFKLFLLGAVAGAVTFVLKPQLMQEILKIFSDKFGESPDKNFALAQAIFTQNITACALALFGGVVLGIAPFLIVFFNGFILGFIVIALLLVPGNLAHNLFYIIGGLAPHGILEIPAFFVASALGIRLGTEWLKKESVGNRSIVFKQNVIRVLQAIPLVLILLAFAALLEVFVSGRIVDTF